MASTVQKIQDKLFGRAPTGSSNKDTIEDLGSSERVDQPSLTINIPKDSANTPNTAPKRKNDNPDSEDNVDQAAATPPLRPYRDRLSEKLGEKYKGAEKYRLAQDNNREKHWKRWGPYLSDRQWVCIQ
jgi:hypothetical protein